MFKVVPVRESSPCSGKYKYPFGTSVVDLIACGFALVAEKSGIASAGAGTTVRVCMGLSLLTIQSY